MVFKRLSCSSKMYPDFEIHPSTATLIFDLQQWNDIDDDSFKNEGQSDDDEDGSGNDIDYRGRRTAKSKRRKSYDLGKEEQQSDDQLNAQCHAAIIATRPSFNVLNQSHIN